MFSDDRKLKLSMVEEHYYSTTPGASSERLLFTAGSQAARLLSRAAVHGSDFLQVFYSKKDVLCALIISDVKEHFNGNYQRVGAIAL